MPFIIVLIDKETPSKGQLSRAWVEIIPKKLTKASQDLALM